MERGGCNGYEVAGETDGWHGQLIYRERAHACARRKIANNTGKAMLATTKAKDMAEAVCLLLER